MLRLLTSKMRFKAAFFVAVLYAFTVLAPHVAVAFAGPASPVHCLTVQKTDHEKTVKVHAHEDGVTHTHNDGAASDSTPSSSDDNGPAAACCGLFCATGMVASDTRILTTGPVVVTIVSVFPPSRVVGTGPCRINRPPIA